MDRNRAILLDEPHLATATGDFVTDMVAPAAISGAGSARVRTCGKNLFDPAPAYAVPSDTTVANSTKRLITPFTYFTGASYSNYYGPGQVTSYSVSNDTISIVSKSGYGVGYSFRLPVGETYILSAASCQYGAVNIIFYRADGSYIGYGAGNVLNVPVTIPANTVITVYILLEPSTYYGAYTAVFSGLQLEKGSAATTYEPYSGSTSYGPTGMTTRRGLNSVLTDTNGVSIKYWKH